MPTKVVGANGATAGWTSPANAESAVGDNVYATAAPAKSGSVSSDFTFPSAAIPAGVTITAVRLVAEWKLSASVTGGILGLLGKNSGVADPAAETTSTSLTEIDSTFTFATKPSITDLNTAGRIAATVRCSKGSTNTAVTGSLDFVRLEVDYVFTGTANDTLSLTDKASYLQRVKGLATGGFLAKLKADNPLFLFPLGDSGTAAKDTMGGANGLYKGTRAVSTFQTLDGTHSGNPTTLAQPYEPVPDMAFVDSATPSSRATMEFSRATEWLNGSRSFTIRAVCIINQISDEPVHPILYEKGTGVIFLGVYRDDGASPSPLVGIRTSRGGGTTTDNGDSTRPLPNTSMYTDVTFVYDAVAQQRQIYLDGVLEHTFNDSASSSSVSANTTHGIAFDQSVAGSGALNPDEYAALAVYTRALTATEVAAQHAALTTAPPYSENLTFTDSANGSLLVTVPSRTSADSLTFTDTASRAASTRQRTSNDSLTLTDTAGRAAASRPRTASESLTLTDSAPRTAATRARTGAELLTLTDTAPRVLGGAPTPVLDTFTDGSAPRDLPTYNGLWAAPLIASEFIPKTTAGGALTGISGGIIASAYYPSVSVADEEVFATVATRPANGQWLELALRAQNPNTATLNGYVLVLFANAGTDSVELWKFNGGSGSQVTVFQAANYAAGDVFKLRAVGTTITAYKNGVQIGAPVTDASVTGAGTVGVRFSDNSGALDNFGAGPVGTGGLARTGSETLTFTDSAPSAYIPASVLLTRTGSESLTFTDSAPSARTFSRTANESLSFTDAGSRAAILRARTSTDTLTFSDTAPRSPGARARTSTNTLTFADTANRTPTATARTASEPLTLTDSTARAVTAIRAVLESVTFTDATARSPQTLPRTVVEALSLADTTARGAATRARTSSDTLTFADTASRGTATRVRIATDSLTFTDTTPRAPQTLPRTAAESLSLADTVAGGAAAVRTSSDTLTFADTDARGVAIRVRIATESLTFIDTSPRSPTSISKTASESLTLTDAALRAAALRARAAIEALAFNDTAVTHVATRLTATEALSLTDASAAIRGTFNALSESLTFADTASRAPGLRTRTSSDTLSFADSTAERASLGRITADPLTFTDAAGRAATQKVRAASESLTLADTSLRAALLRGRTSNESLTFADATSTSTRPSRVAIDTLTFTDAAPREFAYTRLASDTLTFSDSAARVITTLPATVTITSGPSRAKISKVIGYDATSITWGTDLPFEEYVVGVVPTEASPFNTATPIPALHGSINVAGSGAFPETDDIETTIEGADLELASAGDGDKIVRVFVRRGDQWSGS